jgi:hypothetical protein
VMDVKCSTWERDRALHVFLVNLCHFLLIFDTNESSEVSK